MSRNYRSKAYAQTTKNVSFGVPMAKPQTLYDNRGPFGPGVAQDIFECYDSDDYAEECCDADDGRYYHDLDPADLFDGEELQSYHFQYQPGLDLETTRELEARLRNAIRKFESSWNKMSIYALKWHYLMEELEEDSQLKKQFLDIQLMRKLKGSDCV